MKNLLAAAKDWKNLVFVGSLLAIAGWVYSRVAMVNPAILGDEYLYSINARKAAPWDPSPAGDFSNYLFNFVYSSTNLCGDAFYTCGKLVNLIFFVGFLVVIFVVAKRYLNFWVAYGFVVAVGLSPLSVYTSMFLPETMYFFCLSLVFAFVLKAAETYHWKDWAVVGVLLGVASLVKPHAWLSAMAIGIFLVVVGLTNVKYRFKLLGKAVGAIIGGAVVGRVVVGFLVAGPKALGFFGMYVNAGMADEFSADLSTGVTSPASAVGTTPLQGAIALFGSQLWIHTLTNFALMSLAIMGIIAGVIELAKTKEASKTSLASLLGLIWLVTLVIQVVLFTGWITGGGDDHTTRVLERYYDFLFVFAPLTGLIALASGVAARTSIWLRAPLAFVVFIFITPAFSGFFGTLTIQIADAPNLAGLVVNQDVFNGVALLSFASLLVFAFAPKFTPWMLALLLPVTMIGTGYQIQDQYQGFRSELSAADQAGQYAAKNWSAAERESTLVLATSRFEATNAAIWVDVANLPYELFGAGSVYDANMAPSGTSWIIAIGEITATGNISEVIEGSGYKIYKLAE